MTEQDAGSAPQNSLAAIREEGMMDYAGDVCTYCRDEDSACRPVPVIRREYIPSLCYQCYCALNRDLRLDRERNREVFYPNV